MLLIVRRACLFNVLGRSNMMSQYIISNHRRCMHPSDQDDDESNIEDFMEASINDPHATFPQSGPAGKQSVKKQLDMQQRKMRKDATIKKKLRKLRMLKLPLLTWAAKAQIKHLNQTDPIYWTPQMLSKSFPASYYEIVEILKDNRLPVNDDEIYCHDKMVHQNWLMLKEAKLKLTEGSAIDPKLRRLVESRLLDNIRNAAGTKLLSNPNIKQMLLTQEVVAEKNKPQTDRLFSSILDNNDRDMKTVKQDSTLHHIRLEDEDIIGLLEEISHCTQKRQMKAETTNMTDISNEYRNIHEHSDEERGVYKKYDSTEEQYGEILKRK
ncbi:hypothetical protein ACF0H5_013064 [Mactra antiquata]